MSELKSREIVPVPSSRALSLSPEQVNWVEIGEDAAGQRIDNFLLRVCRGVPKSHVYRILRSGEVRVNRSRCSAERRLEKGDVVRVPPMRIAQRQEAGPRAAPLPDDTLPILYEDRDLLVVDKPAGLACHGGSGIAFGLIERLRASRPGEPFLELAHRLDRDTSGAIVICKSRRALVRLQRQMREGGVEKHYRALVKGDWQNERQHVKLPLFKYVTREGERRVRVDEEKGVPAHSIFTLLRRYGPVSYLDVELLTGRTHQIRVHAAASGFPLVGDDKYGDFDFNRSVEKGSLGVPFRRMFLHAARLSFEHPVTREPLLIEAPLPVACRNLLDTLDEQRKKAL
ncbi:RluA family pseudouridine synthase [Mesosutterella sp. AGMB02718]|uniref:Pseudouridine synthase n=1 Tax=Mesosutterella faecium TaxID=2925194 RepID=A0ABT7ILN2_9BURK|nr:RluA family pseudouridine synthase [Mesosutterella sp. AGMB02718]MDL2059275.1 RluA family pseudouridine synthase [Mesosutterella sp. AGMB02718]